MLSPKSDLLCIEELVLGNNDDAIQNSVHGTLDALYIVNLNNFLQNF